MPKEKGFREMEAEVREQVKEKGNFAEVVKKTYPEKKSDIWQELKQDPDLRASLVPVPDYGMLSAILLMRIENRLKKVEDAINKFKS